MKQRGMEKSSIKKTYLNNEQKASQLAGATQRQALLHTDAIFVYLEEKWLYSTSRHCKLNYLPRAEFKEE